MTKPKLSLYEPPRLIATRNLPAINYPKADLLVIRGKEGIEYWESHWGLLKHFKDPFDAFPIYHQ